MKAGTSCCVYASSEERATDGARWYSPAMDSAARAGKQELCPRCLQPVDIKARRCPHCGDPLSGMRAVPILLTAVGLALAVLVLLVVYMTVSK